jgi:hypothetical protein
MYMKHQLLKMSTNQKTINAELIHTLPNELQNKVFLYVGPSVTNLPTSQEIADAVHARQERIDYGDMPPLMEPLSDELQHMLSIAVETNLTVDELMEDPGFAHDVEQRGLTIENIEYLLELWRLPLEIGGINLSEAFEAEVELM